MPRIRCLRSLLCAAVTVTLIVMAAFGSAAFAQPAQTSVRSWTGRFAWTHDCEGPPGWRGKSRGIGDLALDYDGRGNLTGTLAGTTPEGLTFAPGCSWKSLAPGTFSAKLVGSYTPGQNTFSAQATNVQTTPGRVSVTCSHAPGTYEAPALFYAAFQSPMFGDAFRDLRRQPDGSLKSNGERATGTERTPCTTKYSLTLHGPRDGAGRGARGPCGDCFWSVHRGANPDPGGSDPFPSAATVRKGATVALEVSSFPCNDECGALRSATWTSSNTSVATVSPRGTDEAVVTAVGVGSTMITVHVVSEKATRDSDPFTVTVTP